MRKAYLLTLILLLTLKLSSVAQYDTYVQDSLLVVYDNDIGDSLAIAYDLLSEDTDTTWILSVTGTDITFDATAGTVSMTDSAYLKSLFGPDTLATLPMNSDFKIADLIDGGWQLDNGNPIKVSRHSFIPDLVHLTHIGGNKTDSAGHSLSGQFDFRELDRKFSLPENTRHFVNQYVQKLDTFSLTDTFSFSFAGFDFKDVEVTIDYKLSGNFEVSGGVDFIVGEDTLKAQLGNADQGLPGIELEDGKISSLLIYLNTSFSLLDFDFSTNEAYIKYVPDEESFLFYGDTLKVAVHDDSLTLGLGAESEPGGYLKDGAIDTLRFDLYEGEVLGLFLKGESLVFDYVASDEQFDVYGGPDTLGFVQHKQASDGSTTTISHDMVLSFGTATEPGLQFKAGELLEVDLTVTDTLSIESVGLLLDDITIGYDQDSALFELYGTSIGFALSHDTLTLGFGDKGAPGLLFGEEGLKSIHLFLDDTVSIAGLSLYPDSVTFQYNSDSSFYEIYGPSIGVGFEGHDLLVQPGSEDDPGVIFKNGELFHANFGLSDTIRLGGASFKMQDAFFEYDRTKDHYEIYGGPVDLLIAEDSIEGSFGTVDDPGLVIDDGTLDAINVTLTSGGKLLGFELLSDGINLQWTKSSQAFEVSKGVLELKYDQDSLSVSFEKTGDALIIKSGEVQQFQGELTSNFSVSGLDFSTDSLLFKYEPDSGVFELHSGVAQIHFDQDSLVAYFGNDSLPGVVIDGGRVVDVAFVASAHDELLGLTVGIDSLGVVYESSEGLLSMYDREILVIVDSDSVKASLGSPSNPGLVFRAGELEQYSIGITSDFKFRGIEIQPEDLVFAYDFGQEHFEMYDSIKVVIDGQEIDGFLGDEEDPGIIVVDGSLTELNVEVNSDITLGGMELIATGAGIRWPDSVTSTNQTALFGDFQVKELWNADLSLGNDSQPGILIVEKDGSSSFEVENLDLKLGEVHVGFATIENMELKYDPDTLMVACTLIVSDNFEALGDIELVRDSPDDSWKLNNVGLGFEILPPNEGLPVGPVFLQGASAQVNNLTQENDLQIEGSFQLSSGEPYTYEGNEGFLMFLDATGTYDPGQFDLDLDLYIGAYFDAGATPNWNSTIGDATLDADFNWAEESYTLSGAVLIPTNYGVKTSTDIIINDDVTAMYGDVEIRVPEGWDFIGGDVLGNIGGALYLDHNNTDDSYAAGWTTFDIGCISCNHWYCDGDWTRCAFSGTYGLQFNFGQESFSEIGQSGVDNIQKQFNASRAFGIDNTLQKQTFEIMITDEEVADHMTVKLLFDQDVDPDSLGLSVIGPHKMLEPSLTLYDSINGYTGVESLDSIPPGTMLSEISLSIAESFDEGKTNQNFKSNNKAVPKLPELEKGMYEIVVMAPAQVTMESVLGHSKTFIDLEVSYDQSGNMAEIKTFSWVPQVHLQASYDSTTNTVHYKHKSTPHATNSEKNAATIKVFVDTDSVGYDGKLIGELPELDSTFQNSIQIHATDWEVVGNKPGEPLYFYASIADKTNAPVLSKYTTGITPLSRITGQLVNVDGSEKGVSGVVVFLDLNQNGKLDLNRIPKRQGETPHNSYQLDTAEPSCVTDANGNFYFDSHRHSGKGLEVADYSLEYYLKRGFTTDQESPVSRGHVIQYTGEPIAVEVKISKQ